MKIKLLKGDHTIIVNERLAEALQESGKATFLEVLEEPATVDPMEKVKARQKARKQATAAQKKLRTQLNKERKKKLEKIKKENDALLKIQREKGQ